MGTSRSRDNLMMAANFYHAFETNFRGTREEIRQRLEVYAPFVQPIIEQNASSRGLDLGCGRGEWLELMRDTGLSVHGVDLDEGMLQDCIERKLSVEKTEAVAYLRSLPSASLDVVSGFHIAEHLPFGELQALISESFRVLRPGGLLILETPNAENISVGTLTFHMDPTHVRPLPPGLLSFLPTLVGFSRVKVLRLQESKSLYNARDVRLLDVIQGVSPDYSIIAQKRADPEFLNRFDVAFAADYGLTLDTLSERFEASMVSKNDFDGFVARIESFVARTEQNINDHQQRVTHLEQQLIESQKRLTNVYESTSWRITKPLRTVSALKREVGGRGRDWMKSMAAAAFRKTANLTATRPRVRHAVLRLLTPWPGVTARLRRFVNQSNNQPFKALPHTLENELPPRAKRVLEELKRQRSL